jgi:hypothetical protein
VDWLGILDSGCEKSVVVWIGLTWTHCKKMSFVFLKT